MILILLFLSDFWYGILNLKYLKDFPKILHDHRALLFTRKQK